VIALCRGFGVTEVAVEKTSAVKRQQQPGEYCGGADLEECRRFFGAAQATVCSTCPN
jgi:hypothetical protein